MENNKGEWKSHNEGRVLVLTGIGLITGKKFLMETEFGPFGYSGEYRDICTYEDGDH